MLVINLINGFFQKTISVILPNMSILEPAPDDVGGVIILSYIRKKPAHDVRNIITG